MLSILNDLLNGFMSLLHPMYLLFAIAGIVLGMVVGSIPGLSAVLAISLLVPFTYSMDPAAALVFLTSVFMGGMYGGTTTGILFNIPGDSDSAMSAVDGYPLTKKGLSSKALGYAIVATSIGCFIGTIALVFGSNFFISISTMLGPVEIFGLCMIALVSMIYTGDGPAKNGMVILAGLFLSTVGIAPLTGGQRFTFGSEQIQNGFEFIPAIIGLFAMSEVFMKISDFTTEKFGKNNDTKVELPKARDYASMKGTFSRSSLLGVVIGSLPGIGATVASVVGYGAERKLSKKGKDFGTGVYEGVIAPQTASASAAVSTFIPLLGIGIPGGAVAAILIGVFEIHGLTPGPMLFREGREIVYTLFASFFLASILVLIVGLMEVKTAVKLMKIPQSMIWTFISVFAIMGAFATNHLVFDIFAMLFFGVLGFIAKKLELSIPALVLGLILGPIIEPNFLRALITYDNNPLLFFTSPLGGFFIIVALVLMFLPVFKKNKSLTQDNVE